MEDLEKETVYILDSYGLIYRCYFAFINRPLTNQKGENVSALFGFFRNLHAILKNYKPSFLYAAMDSKTATFRHEFYKEYKANRPKTPEDLHAQIPMIQDVLSSLGVPVLQCDGYEADDVIATVAGFCESASKNCRILSGDKDLMQLVNDSTWILKPDSASMWKLTGTEGVQAEWGVKPAQLLDLLSLYGDSADNIPGVQGIGVKTAGKLLSEYENLDGIYAHIDEIKGAVQKKLIEGKENAYFSQKLVKLCNTVPRLDLENVFSSKTELNYSLAAKKLYEYGVPSVAKQYEALAKQTGQSPENSSLETTLFEKDLSQKTELSSSEQTLSLFDQNEDKVPAINTIIKNEGNYKAILKKEELKEFIDKALSKKTVAFDCETDSLDTFTGKIVGFSLCVQSKSAVYVPLLSNNLFESAEFISKEDAFFELRRIFSNPEMNVILHNAKFDLKMLFSNGVISCVKPECKISDTMIAYWLLNPDRTGKNSYALGYLGETVLNLKGIEYSDIVEKNQTFLDVPLEKAVPYASEDADFTFQLWEKLSKSLLEEGLSELFFNTEMALLPILAQMEINGIHLDSNILKEYDKELTSAVQNLEQEIYKEVGHSFNISSPLQLQTVLFEERKLKKGKKTKRGYSTDTSVLEELAMYDVVPKMVLEYRELTKLKSTYVETLPLLCDKNGRIHTDYFQAGTATGRLSSRDPNLQNIPVRNDAGRRIRSAFTAPEGKVLISADYSQIELVVLAHLSGDKNMCNAFKTGIDVHKATASLIFGVDIENVTSEMRRTAKTINFGVIYGMSAFRLSQDLGISRTQASEFINQYFTTYADIQNFITNTITFAEENGFVKTIFGRKRNILQINSRNKIEKSAAERIAVNTPVQGSAADIVKKAMIDVQSSLLESGSSARLLVQVHDELILECDDNPEEIQKTIALVTQKMENAVQLSVPLKVSVEYGKNWGEFH